MSAAEKICAICGVAVATTRDHVPPKGVFLPPRPNNLVTVPACRKCNQGASKFDESFIAFLALHVGDSGETSKGTPLFKKALRIIRHNSKLRQSILKSSRPVNQYTPQGIFLGLKYAVLWDSESHTRVLSRTVRGLYYHHFREVLPADTEIKITWHHQLSEEIFKMSLRMKQVSIGGDDFIYRYARAEEVPEASCWIFQFYGGHWAGAFTDRPGRTQ